MLTRAMGMAAAWGLLATTFMLGWNLGAPEIVGPTMSLLVLLGVVTYVVLNDSLGWLPALRGSTWVFAASSLQFIFVFYALVRSNSFAWAALLCVLSCPLGVAWWGIRKNSRRAWYWTRRFYLLGSMMLLLWLALLPVLPGKLRDTYASEHGIFAALRLYLWGVFFAVVLFVSLWVTFRTPPDARSGERLEPQS